MRRDGSAETCTSGEGEPTQPGDQNRSRRSLFMASRTRPPACPVPEKDAKPHLPGAEMARNSSRSRRDKIFLKRPLPSLSYAENSP